MKKKVAVSLILSINIIMGLLYSYSKAEGTLPIVEEIMIDLTKETPEIKIASNITIEYLDYTLEKPPRIIIDPLGVVYSDLNEVIFSGKDLLQSVSVVKARGDVPEDLGSGYYPLDFVIIELKKPVYYKIVREEKLVVQLGKEIPQAVEEKVVELAEQPRIKITELTVPGEKEREIAKLGIKEERPEVARLEVGREFFDEEKFPFVERYRIEPGDELEISVWQHPDLLRKVVVRPDGFISFPLSGELEVRNLTTDRVAQEITLRLSRILRKPEVSVIVTGFRSEGVFVLGAVNKPGVYPYRADMTALSAISSADSWQQHAYLKSVLIVKRFFAEDAEVIRLNLWDIVKEGEVKKDIKLQPGDIVYVPQSFIGNIGTFLDGLRIRFGTGAHYAID